MSDISTIILSIIIGVVGVLVGVLTYFVRSRSIQEESLLKRQQRLLENLEGTKLDEQIVSLRTLENADSLRSFQAELVDYQKQLQVNQQVQLQLLDRNQTIIHASEGLLRNIQKSLLDNRQASEELSSTIRQLIGDLERVSAVMKDNFAQPERQQPDRIANALPVPVSSVESRDALTQAIREPTLDRGLSLASQVDVLTVYQQVADEYRHDIKTPLSSIASTLDIIKKALPNLLERSSGASSESANNLLSSVEDAEISITSIQSILRQRAGFLPNKAHRFSLEELVAKAIRMVTATGEDRLEPEVSLQGLPEINYYSANLLIALVSLLENAYEAADSDGIISIQGQQNTSTGEIEVLISNSGPPIPTDLQKNIFEPGVSTKGPGRGLGLGIARRCLESVQGRIDLVASADNRTVFKIVFSPEETD